MLSKAYFLAKFRFDTAENEPAKNLQKKCKKMLIHPSPPTSGEPRRPAEVRPVVGRRGGAGLGPFNAAFRVGRRAAARLSARWGWDTVTFKKIK